MADCENDLVFTFFSDVHTMEYFEPCVDETVLVADRASRKLNVDAIVNGGDTCRYGREDMSYVYTELKSVANKITNKGKLINAVGNHDYNGIASVSQNESWTVTPEQIYNLLGSNLEEDTNITWGSKSRMYYYKDYPNKKFRLIVLNSSDAEHIFDESGVMLVNSLVNAGYRQDQLEWLANTALDFTDKTDWHTIVVSHVGWYGTEEGLTTPLLINRDAVKAVVKNFIAGTSESITFTDTTTSNAMFSVNIAVNFTTQGAMSFVGIFSGHNHKDLIIDDTTNGIHQVVTTCAYPGSTNDPLVDRTPNTYNAIAFDTIIVNKTTRAVILKRFGAGEDRTYNY